MITKETLEKFSFYDGADSIESLFPNLNRLGLGKSKCYFIRFLDQFYAVFYQSAEKEVIVGKEKVFYTRNGRMRESNIASLQLDYTIDSRTIKTFMDTLAAELSHKNSFLAGPIGCLESIIFLKANIPK